MNSEIPWRKESVLDAFMRTSILEGEFGSSTKVMHLMRCLSFFMARWDVTLVCQHIPGVEINAADALSRDALSLFQQLVPGADKDATHIPGSLIQCLVTDSPDWTKVDWVTLFKGWAWRILHTNCNHVG